MSTDRESKADDDKERARTFVSRSNVVHFLQSIDIKLYRTDRDVEYFQLPNGHIVSLAMPSVRSPNGEPLYYTESIRAWLQHVLSLKPAEDQPLRTANTSISTVTMPNGISRSLLSDRAYEAAKRALREK